MKPLPDLFSKALLTAFQRYNAYLEAFGPDEAFLRKKVENELGTRMIHLKMRCGGLGSEWGKVESSMVFLLRIATYNRKIALPNSVFKSFSRCCLSIYCTQGSIMLAILRAKFWLLIMLDI